LKRCRWILVASLLLNAALLSTLAYLEAQHRVQRALRDLVAGSWARYAGAMQAHADFGNGVRRLYRPTPATLPNERSGFTGTREGDAEVWSWVYHREPWGGDRASAESFADGYNQRMKKDLADPASYEPHGPAAGRDNPL